MRNKLFLALLVLLLIPIIAFAQEDNVNPVVIYHGIQMRESDLLRDRTAAIYCTLIIDDTVVERGYWDGRHDRLVCFDTNAEALEYSNSNRTVKDVDNSKRDMALLLATCDNLDRGTGFGAPLYGGAYPTVCANRIETYIGGTDNIQSVWLENPIADSVCPRIYIRENYYPPKYTYVDYSSAFTNFIYVAWYQWSPKTC